jgi:beta-lactamase class A
VVRSRLLPFLLVLSSAATFAADVKERTPRPLPIPLASPSWPVVLQTEVLRLARGFTGEFAFYVEDLLTGARYGFNSATPFYLASMVKVGVLRELYRQLERGTLSLTETITMTSDAIVDGTGAVKLAAPGTRFTIDDLVTRMISESDNTAADLLINRVGLAAINQGVREVHREFGPITTLRQVRVKIFQRLSPRATTLTPAQLYDLGRITDLNDRAAALGRFLGGHWTGADLERAFDQYYAGPENSASMEAMARLFESIARCEGFQEATCRLMLDKLLHCETGKERLRAGFPPAAVFAHKTGTQNRRICDGGLLFLANDHPVVIVACAKNFPERPAAEALFARLGHATHDALVRPATPFPPSGPGKI